MKVILSAEIDKLGNAGDLVKVKDGYARNFLIPRGLAIRADERNVKQLQHNQRAMESRRVRLLADAESALKVVSSVGRIVVTKACGPDGKLFGSLTSRELCDLLAEREVQVDKRQVVLNEPLKALGEFEVKVKLGQGVLGTVEVTIEPDEASAKLMAEAKAAGRLDEDKAKKAPRVSDRAWTGDDSEAGDSLRTEAPVEPADAVEDADEAEAADATEPADEEAAADEAEVADEGEAVDEDEAADEDETSDE